ncbi:MAG: PEP-CTERM sorting domain-containing protein [Terrimicrobiaceae bacterium]
MTWIIADDFRLEYDTGSGWTTATSFQPPTTSYALVSHTFAPGLLDNLSNVQLRITFSTLIAVADVFEVDNLTITAVPEPSTLALLGLCCLALLLKFRKPA